MTKPCRKCGSTERYKNGNCGPCNRKASRQYRKEHLEERREAARRWVQENPEKNRERNRCWAQANPEKRAEYNRRYRAKYPEKHKERLSEYSKNNPEKRRATWHRRKARKNQVLSTPYDFKAICNHYGNVCLCCGVSPIAGERKTMLTPDHVVPISKGGPDTSDNIQPICLKCNTSKGDHHQTDYRPDRGVSLPKQLSFL